MLESTPIQSTTVIEYSSATLKKIGLHIAVCERILKIIPGIPCAQIEKKCILQK